MPPVRFQKLAGRNLKWLKDLNLAIESPNLHRPKTFGRYPHICLLGGYNEAVLEVCRRDVGWSIHCWLLMTASHGGMLEKRRGSWRRVISKQDVPPREKHLACRNVQCQVEKQPENEEQSLWMKKTTTGASSDCSLCILPSWMTQGKRKVSGKSGKGVTTCTSRDPKANNVWMSEMWLLNAITITSRHQQQPQALGVGADWLCFFLACLRNVSETSLGCQRYLFFWYSPVALVVRRFPRHPGVRYR